MENDVITTGVYFVYFLQCVVVMSLAQLGMLVYTCRFAQGWAVEVKDKTPDVVEFSTDVVRIEKDALTVVAEGIVALGLNVILLHYIPTGDTPLIYQVAAAITNATMILGYITASPNTAMITTFIADTERMELAAIAREIAETKKETEED